MATDTRSIAIALPCTLKDKLCRKTRQASSAETTRRRARRGFQPTLPRTRCGARNDARHALTITSQCARDETATHAHASRGGGGLMNAPAPNPHTDHCAGRCKCRRRHSAGDDQVLQYPKAKCLNRLRRTDGATLGGLDSVGLAATQHLSMRHGTEAAAQVNVKRKPRCLETPNGANVAAAPPRLFTSTSVYLRCGRCPPTPRPLCPVGQPCLGAGRCVA